MDFFLFLVLNGVLFLRPEELFPSIAGLQIYYWVICTNLIVCSGAIFKQLEGKELAKNPVTVCVLGVLATIFLSHASKLDLYSARMGAFEFLKVVLYFLLLLSVVNTKKRLIWFLFALVVLILSINTFAILQYHGAINIEALEAYMQNDVDENGEAFAFPRMVGTGIFNDPNDLSMIIVAAILLCGAGLFAPKLGVARFALAAPIGYLLYALTLTQSRGGLLALMAGCGTVFYLRYGWQKTALIGALGVPVVLAVGGRQADIGGAMSGGTGESRTELWSEGIQLFKSSPLFGIGYKNFAEEVGHVAHNSFLHSATELGFFGGMFFLGVFAVSAAGIWQAQRSKRDIKDATLRQLLPYMLALLVAYGVSMLSLSRSYAIPTYLIAGLAAAYLHLATGPASFRLPTFNGPLLQRLATAEVGMIAATYAFIQVSIRL